MMPVSASRSEWHFPATYFRSSITTQRKPFSARRQANVAPLNPAFDDQYLDIRRVHATNDRIFFDKTSLYTAAEFMQYHQYSTGTKSC
jgi:hypothetical protein